MNRVDFFDSISGINYPDMMVRFFDHFIALKQLVEDSGSVQVLSSTDTSIEFSISFKNSTDLENALNYIRNNSVVNIYNRPISVSYNVNGQSITINLS